MKLLQALAGNMLEITLALSVVIAALLLLRPLLKKRYRAKLFYWVWLAAALRLVILWNPTLPEVPMRIPTTDAAIVYTRTEPVAGQGTPAVGQWSISTGQTASAPTVPAGTGELLPSAPDVDQTIPEQVQKAPVMILSLTELLTLLWLAGGFAFLGWNLLSYARFRRRVRRWKSPEEDPAVLAQFEALRETVGVKRLTLARCEAVSSPLVTGFVRPELLLPPGKHSPETLDAIFRHELVHTRRRDLWYKLLLLAARSIHWFNPLAHLMARQAGRDLELSCDETVISGQDEDFRKSYSRAILSAVEGGVRRDAPLTSYFHGGKAALLERLKAIVNENGRRRGIALACALALLVGVVAAACSVAAREPELSPRERAERFLVEADELYYETSLELYGETRRILVPAVDGSGWNTAYQPRTQGLEALRAVDLSACEETDEPDEEGMAFASFCVGIGEELCKITIRVPAAESAGMDTNWPVHFLFDDGEEYVLTGPRSAQLFEVYDAAWYVRDHYGEVAGNIRRIDLTDEDSGPYYLTRVHSALLTAAMEMTVEYTQPIQDDGETVFDSLMEVIGGEAYRFDILHLRFQPDGTDEIYEMQCDESFARSLRMISASSYILVNPVPYERDYVAPVPVESEIAPEELLGMLPRTYWFHSGAGGWRTELNLGEDGTFSGDYKDSDATVTYFCRFWGTFAQPERIAPFTWSLKIESMTTDGSPSAEEYIEGVRYVPSKPYGVNDTEELLLYLPGVPMSELPEGVLHGARVWGEYLPEGKLSDYEYLPFYVLYNPAEDAGFVALTEDHCHALVALTADGQTFYDDVQHVRLSFKNTIFQYGERSYDLSERDPAINAITDYKSVGKYIIIEGHTGPKHNVYCIFNTETQEFEKDITGANLTFYNDDINTVVYSFWSDICAYDGTVIGSCELGESDYISGLAFTANNTKVEANVMTADGSYYTKTFPLP